MVRRGDVALDGLIEMKEPLPPGLIPIIFERRPVQALILVSHAPEGTDEFLLQVLRQSKYDQWLWTAANSAEAHDGVKLRRARGEGGAHGTGRGDTTFPGSAFVNFPSSTTATPLTNTNGMPTGYWCGSVNVARSAMDSSKITRSAR